MKNDLSVDGYRTCALCDSRILFKNPDKTLNLDNYREVSFVIKKSDRDGGGLMTVGFCLDCVEKARTDKSLFNKITDSVKEGWQIEFDHDKVEKELQDKYWLSYGDMQIIDLYQGEQVGAS